MIWSFQVNYEAITEKNARRIVDMVSEWLEDELDAFSITGPHEVISLDEVIERLNESEPGG